MAESSTRARLLEKFRDISLDRLRILNQGILEIEKGNREENLVNQLMREIHTLKGESRMMGFSSVNLISHRIEDLLKSLQAREFQFQTGDTDLLFAGLDAIAKLVQKKIEETSPDLEELAEKLSSVAEGHSAPAPRPAEPEKAEAPRTRSILFSGEEESIRVGIDKLEQLSETASDIFINQIRYHNFPLILKELRDGFRNYIDSSNGELSIEALQQFQKRLNQILGEFQVETMKMDHTVSTLQDQVREIRLLPLSTLFDLFPRTVRDLAKEFAKEIDLEIKGGSIELDKMMLDRIHDPLIHLIRNSIDHGIEIPEVRVQSGKPRAGKIFLTARPEGDRICIEVKDDGNGIDPQKILQSALKKQLLSSTQAENLSQREIISLIFTPGFSTKEMITDLSGRGVGLDVVKTNIEGMEGSIEVLSEPGEGTSFILRLPPSLNITKVLLLYLNENLLAIPSSIVLEVIKIPSSEILSVEGQKVIHYRGWTIPILSLAEVLNLRSSPPEENEKNSVVVLELAQEKIALIVDKIISEREIAVKPLEDFLGGIRNLAGATLLEKGELAFLLHVPDLFESAKSRKRPVPDTEKWQTAAEISRKANILIVEDSLITREMEKSILLSYGYGIAEAEDGVQALELLKEKNFDLIITDIEMPNLDGFELTRRIRSSEELRSIPIIIVTTRSSAEDRRRGVEVGADAYMTKSEFQHEKLVEIIQRLTH